MWPLGHTPPAEPYFACLAKPKKPGKEKVQLICGDAVRLIRVLRPAPVHAARRPKREYNQMVTSVRQFPVCVVRSCLTPWVQKQKKKQRSTVDRRQAPTNTNCRKSRLNKYLDTNRARTMGESPRESVDQHHVPLLATILQVSGIRGI